MTVTLAHGFSSESIQRVLSNGYLHARVSMGLRNICFTVLWMKVASALEGLRRISKLICKSSRLEMLHTLMLATSPL